MDLTAYKELTNQLLNLRQEIDGAEKAIDVLTLSGDDIAIVVKDAEGTEYTIAGSSYFTRTRLAIKETLIEKYEEFKITAEDNLKKIVALNLENVLQDKPDQDPETAEEVLDPAPRTETDLEFLERLSKWTPESKEHAFDTLYNEQRVRFTYFLSSSQRLLSLLHRSDTYTVELYQEKNSLWTEYVGAHNSILEPLRVYRFSSAGVNFNEMIENLKEETKDLVDEIIDDMTGTDAREKQSDVPLDNPALIPFGKFSDDETDRWVDLFVSGDVYDVEYYSNNYKEWRPVVGAPYWKGDTAYRLIAKETDPDQGSLVSFIPLKNPKHIPFGKFPEDEVERWTDLEQTGRYEVQTLSDGNLWYVVYNCNWKKECVYRLVERIEIPLDNPEHIPFRKFSDDEAKRWTDLFGTADYVAFYYLKHSNSWVRVLAPAWEKEMVYKLEKKKRESSEKTETKTEIPFDNPDRIPWSEFSDDEREKWLEKFQETDMTLYSLDLSDKWEITGSNFWADNGVYRLVVGELKE